MKLKLLALALIPLSLAACQSNDIQKVGDVAVKLLQQQNASQTLSAYEWHLDTGAEKHMIMQLMADGRSSISTTCNTLSGGWKASTGVLEMSQMAMTMIGCSEQAHQQEKFAAEFLDKAKLPFILNLDNLEQPTLTLTANGQSVTFYGKMTPETKYQSQAETIFLEISPETKSCTGVAAQTCLQVREIKYNEQGLQTYIDPSWSLFYDNIEGFEHNPQSRQIIRVKRYPIKNPAADQSKYAYIHDMTVMYESLKSTP